MARRPADLMAQLTVRVPRGFQGFWEIIRALHRKGRPWTIDDVGDETNVARTQIDHYVRRLVKAGFVAEAGKKKWKDRNLNLYRLMKDQPEAPRLRLDGTIAAAQGSGQDRMWRSMKMLKSFDARELALHSSTDTAQVAESGARQYISQLKRAGYLIELAPAKNGHKPGTGRRAIYKLNPAMNTGPLAPQIQATNFVWDPNVNKVMGPATDARGVR